MIDETNYQLGFIERSPVEAIEHFQARLTPVLGEPPRMLIEAIEEFGFATFEPTFESRETYYCLSPDAGLYRHDSLPGSHLRELEKVVGARLWPAGAGEWTPEVLVSEQGEFFGAMDGSVWPLGTSFDAMLDSLFERPTDPARCTSGPAIALVVDVDGTPVELPVWMFGGVSLVVRRALAGLRSARRRSEQPEWGWDLRLLERSSAEMARAALVAELGTAFGPQRWGPDLKDAPSAVQRLRRTLLRPLADL